jgi:hypothetical protein
VRCTTIGQRAGAPRSGALDHPLDCATRPSSGTAVAAATHADGASITRETTLPRSSRRPASPHRAGIPTTAAHIEWGETDASGLPDIGVPAGFTSVVYDRTTRGSSAALALDPPAIKREVPLPFNVQFLGVPWSEPVLLEIASAYEAARGPRTPPPDFGPLPGEP